MEQNKPNEKWLTKLDEYEPIDLGEDYVIAAEYEFAVVRADNKHGIKSCGWPDENKIVLFDGTIEVDDIDDPIERSNNKKCFIQMTKVTIETAKALNAAGL